MRAMQEMVADDWRAMEQVMTDQLAGIDLQHLPLLPEIANHLLLAGGKRLRPLLCLLAQRLLPPQKNNRMQDDTNPMVYLAAAVEFIHGATLLHDDVIDRATLRRGKKTANNIWGNHLPVLVGDFLFARAFQLMVKVNNQAVLSTLAQTAATLSMGEVWQLSHQLHYQEKFLTLDDYEKIIFAKTGSLFAASFVVAGLLRQPDPRDAVNVALHELGAAIGMIFQLVDDALDYFGDSAKTKKEVGVDFAEGKITLPILLLYRAARDDAAVIKKLNDFFLKPKQAGDAATQINDGAGATKPEEFAWLMTQLRHYNIMVAVDDYIQQFVDRAIYQLDQLKAREENNAGVAARALLRQFILASHQRQG